VCTHPRTHTLVACWPPDDVAVRCGGCARTKQVELVRKIVFAMGNAREGHKRVFFNFEPMGPPAMKLLLEAFPTVPWVYVYRDPAEALASELSRGAAAAPPPCALGMSLAQTAAHQADHVTEYCAAKLGKCTWHACVRCVRPALRAAVRCG